MSEGLLFSVVALVVAAGFGIAAAAQLHRAGGGTVVRVLLLINFVIVYPISGILHILRIDDGSRGYFDLLKGEPSTALMAALMCTCSMFALILGCRNTAKKRPAAGVSGERSEFWLDSRDWWTGFIVAIIILPVSIYSIVQILQYTSTLRAERVLVLDEGLARFAFMSHWFAWGISIVALMLVGTRKPRPEWATVLVVMIASVAIAASLRWSGGRSIVVMMALPLILTILPRLQKARWISLGAGLLAVLIYLSVLTQLRSDSYRYGTGLNFVSWLDWEWGRFSMVGFAVEYTDRSGFLWGQSLWDAFAGTIMGIAKLLGIVATTPEIVVPSEIASREVAGASYSFIVPGLMAELFLNFGLFGALLFYFIGRVAYYIDNSVIVEKNSLLRFSYYFFGAITIFRVPTIDLLGTANYLIYSGLPILICIAIIRARDLASPRKASGRPRPTITVSPTRRVAAGGALAHGPPLPRRSMTQQRPAEL